ncbi:MAG: phosphate ABC transporter permease PstA [Acidimicrobiia bacterium]|nr:phosphate ABC transporter permease PstA [Acidimicrobiia bacterium]MDQ3499646.1 phosphate ABC transporter permease PstA [Actinomycetota bacterium]
MAVTSAPTAEVLVRRSLSAKKRDVRGRVFEAVLILTLLVSMAVLVVLLLDVALDSRSVWGERTLGNFLTSQLSADPATAGIRQALVGSLILMIFTAAIAFPLGISAAIFLEEYAEDNRFARIVNANIRNLAGVPSIVYGLLGLALFVKILGGITGPEVEGRSVISGGLTLGLLVLPIVIITSVEALRAVPNSIREGAFGVGATKWQMIRHHVLPVAAPGILTGTILSLGRAFGEAAPLLLVGGITTFFQSGDATPVEQLRGRFSAMPVLVFRWASLPQAGFRALTAALIVVMLVALLLINATAIYLRNRFEKEL